MMSQMSHLNIKLSEMIMIRKYFRPSLKVKKISLVFCISLSNAVVVVMQTAYEK